jgi:hypothetical protein
MLQAHLVAQQGTPRKQRSSERMWARCLLFVLIITIAIMMLNESSSPVVAEVA